MLADQLHVLYTFQLLRWWYGERIKVHKGLNIIKPSVKVSFLYGGPATLCVDPRPRYFKPDDTHNLCVFCLGKEHARDVLEGKSACTVSFFYVKAPLSSCPSFRGKRGSRLLPAIRDPPLPRHGGE